MGLEAAFNFEEKEAFKDDILATYAGEALASEDEIALDLGENYQEAAEAASNDLLESAAAVNAARNANFSPLLTGRRIWERLRAYLCKVLNAASAAEDIIEAILDFLIGVIPGGMVLKGIVRKILKYFINRGYEALCPVV